MNLLCSNKESIFRQLKKDFKNWSIQNRFDDIYKKLASLEQQSPEISTNSEPSGSENSKNLNLDASKKYELLDIILNHVSSPEDDNFLKFLENVRELLVEKGKAGDETSENFQTSSCKAKAELFQLLKTAISKTQQFLNLLDCNQHVNYGKSVKFAENSVKFYTFYQNKENDLKLDLFLFSGISHQNWQFLPEYHTFERFLTFLSHLETDLFLNTDPTGGNPPSKIQNTALKIQEKNLTSISNFLNYDTFNEKCLLQVKNLKNVVYVLKIITSQIDEDEFDLKSEKFRILLQRAVEAEKISNLENIGDQITLRFLSEHNFDEIISKWVAINFESQILQDFKIEEAEAQEMDSSSPGRSTKKGKNRKNKSPKTQDNWRKNLPKFIKIDNPKKFSGLVGYELATLFSQTLDLKYLKLAIKVIKNSKLIKILHADKMVKNNGYSIELLELIWKHVIAERIHEILNMVERTGHKPPTAKLTKALGLENLEQIMEFLKISKEILDLILHGCQIQPILNRKMSGESHHSETEISTVSTGSNSALQISSAWQYLEELDKEVTKSKSLFSIINENKALEINLELLKLWRALVINLDLIIELDIKLRLRVNKSQILTFRPQKDLGHVSFRLADSKSNKAKIYGSKVKGEVNSPLNQMPANLFSSENYSENLDLELTFKGYC